MKSCQQQLVASQVKSYNDYLRSNGTDYLLDSLEQQLELVQARVLRNLLTGMSRSLTGGTRIKQDEGKEMSS